MSTSKAYCVSTPASYASLTLGVLPSTSGVTVVRCSPNPFLQASDTVSRASPLCLHSSYAHRYHLVLQNSLVYRRPSAVHVVHGAHLLTPWPPMTRASQSTRCQHWLNLTLSVNADCLLVRLLLLSWMQKIDFPSSIYPQAIREARKDDKEGDTSHGAQNVG